MAEQKLAPYINVDPGTMSPYQHGEEAMKQISNKQYEAYKQYQSDRLHGRILTPDGLRIICAWLDNNPEKIGKHMLEMLVKFRNEGLFDIVVADE